MLNLVLESVQIDWVRHARVTNNRVRAEAKLPAGRNEPAAPISEAVAIAFNGNRRARYQIIWTLQFGDAREVHVQRDNHRRCLRKFEAELATDMDTHEISDSEEAALRGHAYLFNRRAPTEASLRRPA